MSGRVQGVWFRAATREQAERLGIDGDARNLDDGRVEVIASGAEHDLNALAAWLTEGPPLARVERVQREAWSEPVPFGFRTG